MNRIFATLFFCCYTLISNSAVAIVDFSFQNVQFLWNKIRDNIKEVWRNSNSIEYYMPLITWHNRFLYDEKHIKRYNEDPCGGGFGFSYYDEKGNWNGLYAMIFRDSFNKWEPVFGYAWEVTWRFLRDKNFHFGLGFAFGLTIRNSLDYIPVPYFFPIISIGYGKLNSQMTYIPGSYNNGNVYFSWIRFEF